MSTHNICFCAEIRKEIRGYPLLSVAMDQTAQMSMLIGTLAVHILHKGLFFHCASFYNIRAYKDAIKGMFCSHGNWKTRVAKRNHSSF